MNELVKMKCRHCSIKKPEPVVTDFKVVGEGVTKTRLRYVKIICNVCGMKAVKITGKAV